MRFKLEGKRALVTGSSRGIGEGVVRALASHGVAVAVHGSGRSGREARIASEIRAAGGEAIAVSGDVADAATCRRLVEQAVVELGGLDILVNNAGGPIADTSAADFEEVLYNRIVDANLKSVLATTAAAHPHLKGGGSIINTGSVAGRTGGKIGLIAYAAAKAAVHSVTRSSAREFGADGIRVNTVAPGFILTPSHGPMPQASLDRLRGFTALDRLGDVDDCLGTFLFFASNAMSGYVTGQIIDVNGGWYMA